MAHNKCYEYQMNNVNCVLTIGWWCSTNDTEWPKTKKLSVSMEFIACRTTVYKFIFSYGACMLVHAMNTLPHKNIRSSLNLFVSLNDAQFGFTCWATVVQIE